MKINLYCQDYKGKQFSAEQVRNQLPIDKTWELVDCDSRPDLAIIYCSKVSYKGIYEKVFTARTRFGIDCFILLVTGESVDGNFPGVDYSISFKADSKNNYYMPFLTLDMAFVNFLLGNIPTDIQTNRNHYKKYFCNFIYSKSSHKRFPGTRVRECFCRLLSQYKRVDCAGRSLNNTDKLKIMEESISNSGNAKINFMRDYKFSIAFENQSRPGYVTEKICHAYLAGTIPIYWGSHNIAKFFNPQSFINCHDYDSFAEVVERVKEVDKNPELFAQYINAHPLADNSVIYNFTKDKISARLDIILEKVVDKRGKTLRLEYPRLHEFLTWSKFVGMHPLGTVYALRVYVKRKLINYFSRTLPRIKA